MNDVAGAFGGRGTRGSQDETSPFPLEFMVARPLGGSRQDETSPFPLDFVVIARQRRASHDETSPFPLEYEVTQPDDEDSGVRVVRRESSPAERPPRQTLGELEVSAQLKEYALRVAAGEVLPPYRGPILAGDVSPRPPRQQQRPQQSQQRPKQSQQQQRPPQPQQGRTVAREPVQEDSGQGKAIVKLALGVMLMMAALVAAAVGGDDAALRAAGASISGWFTGNDGSRESFPIGSASVPCNPRLDGAPAQKP